LRRLLFLIPLFFSTIQVSSQNKQDDVIYLNNGSFLRGTIVKLDPGIMLRIVLARRDTLVIAMADVNEIRKEDVPVESDRNYDEGVKSQGYTFMADVGFGLGKLEGMDRYMDPAESQFSVALSLFNGFTITPYVQLGLNTGIEVWSKRAFLPIRVDFRANFIKSGNTPFAYLDAGYSVGWRTGEPGMNLGGATAGIGLGAKFRVASRHAMLLSLGYRFQQTREWVESNCVRSLATRDAHLISFRIGMMF